MTEERKHAILLATVILTARRLQPLLEEDDKECKPNKGTEFWAEIAAKKALERASHILDLIDEKCPGSSTARIRASILDKASGEQVNSGTSGPVKE